MKIDRSFGIPFVKGFVDIELDKDKIKELMDSIDKKAICDLLLYYLNIKFYQSTLVEGGTFISIGFDKPSNLQSCFLLIMIY